MSWEQEELRRRQKESETKDREVAEKCQAIGRLWNRLLEENQKLAPALQLGYNDYEYEKSLYNKDFSSSQLVLRYSGQQIRSSNDSDSYYKVLEITYDLKQGSLFASCNGKSAAITEHSAPTLIKNCVLRKPLYEEILEDPYEEEQPQVKKSFLARLFD